MSQTSKVLSYSLAGGFVGALVMGIIALMMPVSTPMGGVPFFVAAAMLMGMGSTSTVAGWMLHLITGLIIGGIFGVAVTKVSSLRLGSAGKAVGLGAGAGIVAFFVWFLPMMAMLMPALMGMPMMVAGGFAAHVIYGLVLGGVVSFAVKSSTSYKCPACEADFHSKEELMEHGKAHMSSTPKQEYKCLACGMSFASQQELMDHNAKDHRM